MDTDQAKRAAGLQAMQHIREKMVVGMGTGSTARFFVEALGEAVQQGLRIEAVATSRETEALAREWGIPQLSMDQVGIIDVAVDGADEFDPALTLIKGGGGALYREKLIASLSRELIIVADPSKQVQTLGTFPLPVEVVPFGVEITRLRLSTLNAHPKLRHHPDGSLFYTDNGNLILDCHFGRIDRPAALHRELKSYLGVVETGLFINMATRVLLGQRDGSVKEVLPIAEEE